MFGVNMNSIYKVFFAVLLFSLIASFAGQSWSQDKASMDVVLVMDSSGSMKKTDPLSLRIPAAKLFVSLLDKDDRAAVVSFTDKGIELIPLTDIDNNENREKLMNAIDKITSDGLYTNLYEAFDSGYNILSKGNNAGREKIIVLMSDGMMDVGDADKDRELMQKLKNSLAADLKSGDIKVYTIAFTEQSDRKLLEKISKKTGGFYNLALTDKDFHLIFTSIFESLKKPDMLPMSENGFVIDSSIEEVTIVATKSSPETMIQINSPSGQTYTSIDRVSGVGWFESDNFDMITVNRPIEGKWEILFSTGENNKAYIITNLKLQSNFEKLYAIFGESMEFEIWLEKEGNTIKEEEVLEKIDVYIEMTGPDGKTNQLKPFNKGKGIFYRKVAPFSAGNYKMKIIAKSMTFEREKSFVFNVANVEESKEDIKEMLAEREKEEAVEEEPAEEEPDKGEESDEILWGMTVFQFICINLIIGLAIFIYIKRTYFKNIIRSSRFKKRIKKEKAQDEEGDANVVDTAKEGVDSEAEKDRPPEEAKPEPEKAAAPEEAKPEPEKAAAPEEAEPEPEKDIIAAEETEDVKDDTQMINLEDEAGDDKDGDEQDGEEVQTTDTEDGKAEEAVGTDNKTEPETEEVKDMTDPEGDMEGQKPQLNPQEAADLEGLLKENSEDKTDPQEEAPDLKSEMPEPIDENRKEESEPGSMTVEEKIGEIEPVDSEKDVKADIEDNSETLTEQDSSGPQENAEEEQQVDAGAVENKEEAGEDLDDAWAEALSEQKETESDVKPEKDETEGKEEAGEDLDDAWAEALSEQKETESSAKEETDKTSDKGEAAGA
jgi:hypothetical protein